MTNAPPASSGRPAGSGDAGRTCPYCRFAIKAGTPVVTCEFCRAPHHQDCWSDNGGCSIMGCEGGPAPSGRSAAAAPTGLPTQVHPARPPEAPAPPVPPASGEGGGGGKPATALIVACAVALLAAGGAVAAVLMTRTAGSDVTSRTVTVVSTALAPSQPPPPPPPATTPAASPPASATQTVPATVPIDVPGPSEVIREHFTHLDAGEYDAAFALFTPTYQANVSRWVTVRGAAHPHVNIDYVMPASISGSFAKVPTKIYLRDESGPYPNTACRRFEGELPVEKVGEEWRYAPSGHDWVGVVIPGTNSHCP